MTIKDRDRLFGLCDNLDGLPNLLRAIVEALPVEEPSKQDLHDIHLREDRPAPSPTMPDCVRELINLAACYDYVPNLFRPTIAACRSYYGEV